MNTYYKAILKATSNGRQPEFSDLWRSYHSYARIEDSEHYLYQQDRFAKTIWPRAIAA